MVSIAFNAILSQSVDLVENPTMLSSLTVTGYCGVVQAYRWTILSLVLCSVILTAVNISFNSPLHEASITFMLLSPRWEDDKGKPTSYVLRRLAHPFKVLSISLFESIFWELQSRTLADAVVEELSLQSHYGTKTKAEARALLEANRNILLLYESTVRVSVTDRDPQMAVAIANAHPRQLDRLDQRLHADSASFRKRLYERGAHQALANLRKAEELWYPIYFKSGIPSPNIGKNKRGEAMYLVAGLSNQKIDEGEKHLASINDDDPTKEVLPTSLKLEVLRVEGMLAKSRRFGTARHPAVHQIEARLDALRSVIKQMDSGPPISDRQHFFIPTNLLPEIAVNNSRLARDVKVRDHAYWLWQGMLEDAMIEESLDMPRVRVLDLAESIEHPSRGWETVVVAGGLALILGVISAFIVSYFEGMRFE